MGKMCGVSRGRLLVWKSHWEQLRLGERVGWAGSQSIPKVGHTVLAQGVESTDLLPSRASQWGRGRAGLNKGALVSARTSVSRAVPLPAPAALTKIVNLVISRVSRVLLEQLPLLWILVSW